MTSPKSFWISLAVLLALHTIVSFASYRLFTISSTRLEDGTPVDITTPEQKAAGEKSFRVVTHRTTTPMPVIFYIYGGFVALAAATLFMICTRLRV